MAERWAVAVDDPDMDESHGFVIEADDQGEAVTEGARRAILADRLGCGVRAAVLPEGMTLDTYVMPHSHRAEQAESDDIVEAVARWAVAGRLHEDQPTREDE